nr:Abi family protein [Cryobacterium adonitolivorans]
MERGLTCDTAALEQVLCRTSYYRLSGYLWWFQTSDASHALREGTTLDDVIRLYEFDAKLRGLLLECVQIVEVWFRSQFTNHLANKFGPMAYVDPRYFANPGALKRDKAKLGERLAPPTEVFIESFFRNYSDDYPPVWMATEVMSLGLLSKWFDNLKIDSLRKAIASDSGLNQDVLASYLRQMTVIRNACAHHNRLWNRTFGTGIKLSKQGDPQLLTALVGSDDSKIYRALVYSAYLVKKIQPDSGLPARLKAHIMSGDDDWIIEMDAPNDFEKDDLWV